MIATQTTKRRRKPKERARGPRRPPSRPTRWGREWRPNLAVRCAWLCTEQLLDLGEPIRASRIARAAGQHPRSGPYEWRRRDAEVRRWWLDNCLAWFRTNTGKLPLAEALSRFLDAAAVLGWSKTDALEAALDELVRIDRDGGSSG